MPGKPMYLITCPYDKSHKIMRSRMAVHLVRCARNHPDAKKVTCPFNATHLVNTNEELKKHLETCPDRLAFESHHGSGSLRFPSEENKTHVEERPSCSASKPNLDNVPEHKGEAGATENWDDEPDVPTYDPEASWNDKFVIKNPQGNSRAAKRAFREQERERFQQHGKF